MSTLFEQVGGTSISESEEFKIIAEKIRENAHKKYLDIERKPSKEIKYELIRQGFTVSKYYHKRDYDCGCEWSQCKRCNGGKKIYIYKVIW